MWTFISLIGLMCVLPQEWPWLKTHHGVKKMQTKLCVFCKNHYSNSVCVEQDMFWARCVLSFSPVVTDVWAEWSWGVPQSCVWVFPSFFPNKTKLYILLCQLYFFKIALKIKKITSEIRNQPMQKTDLYKHKHILQWARGYTFFSVH